MKSETLNEPAAKRSARTETVDQYLAAVPQKARVAIERLREIIRAAAPNAVEVISYQVPMFRQDGPLVSFGAAKDHCSFYVMSPAVMECTRTNWRNTRHQKARYASLPTSRFPQRWSRS